MEQPPAEERCSSRGLVKQLCGHGVFRRSELTEGHTHHGTHTLTTVSGQRSTLVGHDLEGTLGGFGSTQFKSPSSYTLGTQGPFLLRSHISRCFLFRELWWRKRPGLPQEEGGSLLQHCCEQPG